MIALETYNSSLHQMEKQECIFYFLSFKKVMIENLSLNMVIHTNKVKILAFLHV